jgi:hypothetical protein
VWYREEENVPPLSPEKIDERTQTEPQWTEFDKITEED